MANALLEQAAHQASPTSRRGMLERIFTLMFQGFVYNQIWEDPSVDLDALKLQPHHKLVTIASGFAGYSFVMFVLLSLVARGMRFYVVAFLLNRYGAQARAIIEERLGFWVSVGAVLLIGGIIAALYLF